MNAHTAARAFLAAGELPGGPGRPVGQHDLRYERFVDHEPDVLPTETSEDVGGRGGDRGAVLGEQVAAQRDHDVTGDTRFLGELGRLPLDAPAGRGVVGDAVELHRGHAGRLGEPGLVGGVFLCGVERCTRGGLTGLGVSDGFRIRGVDDRSASPLDAVVCTCCASRRVRERSPSRRDGARGGQLFGQLLVDREGSHADLVTVGRRGFKVRGDQVGEG